MSSTSLWGQWEKIIPACSKLLLHWCHSSSPASLCSHRASTFSLPPPGHVQALDNIRVLHPRPLNGTLNSLVRWQMSLAVAGGVKQEDLHGPFHPKPLHGFLILAMTVEKSPQASHTCPSRSRLPVPPHPAPPSYTLSPSEELPTRTWAVGMKKKPQSFQGGLFPSQENGDGPTMAEQRKQPGGLSPGPVGTFISESRHQNGTGTSGAALLLHILLLPCPCTAPSPFLFLTMSSEVSE